MKQERGKRPLDTSSSANRTTQPAAPGKTTWTERLHSQGAPAAGAAAHPSRPRHLAIEEDGSAHRELDAEPQDERAGHHGTPRLTAARMVRGTGLAPLREGEVTATVVGSAADSESAFDDSFTPALVNALRANPRRTIDEVLRRIAACPLGDGPDNASCLHHPTIVQYGQKATPAPQGREPRKLAVLVANQNYSLFNRLHTPVAEAEAMKNQLARRGYDAKVHSDKNAASMTALWGSMVSAAHHGDQLMAFYGGHGGPEGLIGIDHDVTPPDIFTNHQVAGVVSSATGKGAHIRFVMDSCHSGSAAQAVREVRENELAAATRSSHGELRVAALAGLRDAKQRLLALVEQRYTIITEAEHAMDQDDGEAADAEAERALPPYRHARRWIPNAFDRAADRLWAEYVPLLDNIRAAIGFAQKPPPITDYFTLGAQVNYLDDLWNAVSQSVERAGVEAEAAKPGPGR